MAYDIKFQVKPEGIPELDRVDALIKQVSASTKASAGELKLFENVLRANIAAGKSFGEALSSAAGQGLGGLVRDAGKAQAEIQKLGRAMDAATTEDIARTQRAAASAQAYGRIMELAYNENHARNLKKITDAAKEAEQTANKTASGILQLASGSGLVSGQFASLTRGAGSLSGGLGSLIGPATIAGGAILASGAATLEAVKAYAEYSRETVKFAERIGVSIAQARQLQNVGQLAGVSAETLASSSRILANALEDSEGAGKKASAALERLGVSTVASNGGIREEGQVLLDVIQKLSAIPDQAERVREANALLGRGSKEILPLVEEYGKVSAVLKDWGIAIDENAIQKGSDAEIQFKALSLALKQFRDEAAKGIAPIVIKFVREAAGTVETGVGIASWIRGQVSGLASLAATATYALDPAAVKEAESLGIGKLTAKDLRNFKPKSGDFQTTPSFDQNALLKMANEQNVSSFLGGIDGSDDKSGLASAKKRLEKARKDLEADAKDSTKAPADIANAERQVTLANEQVRAIEARIEGTKRATEETRKLAEEVKRLVELQARDAEKALKDPVARAIATANRQTDTFTTPDNRRAAGQSGLLDIASAAHVEQAKDIAEQEKQYADVIKADQKAFLDNLRLRIHTGEEAVAADRKVIEFQDALTKQTGAERARAITDAGRLSERLTGLNPQLSEAQKIVILAQESLDIEKQRHEVTIQNIAELINGETRDKAYHEEELTNELNLQRVKEQNIERITELQNRQLQEFRGLVGGAFDSALNHSLGNFIKSQAIGQLRTVVENIAAQELPAIQKLIPHVKDANGRLGKDLQGTIFGADPLKRSLDLNKLALDTNKTALDANTDALKTVYTAMTGKGPDGSTVSGGTSAAPGSLIGVLSSPESILRSLGDDLPLSGSVSSAATLAKALGIGGGGTSYSGLAGILGGLGSTGDLRGILTGVGGPGGATSLSTSERIGGAIGTAGVIAAGTMSAISGFERGGAKGDLQGVGSVLGTGAAVAAMFGPAGAPVALGLGIAAAATTFISELLPDGKKIREQGIEKFLAQSQYIAPQSLTETRDVSGHYVDQDYKGNQRTSPFSAIPQVSEPYLHWHGGSDGTQGFYNVPGNVLNPFSPAPTPQPQPIIIQHNYAEGAIKTIDASGFHDLLQRNNRSVAEAAATSLQDSSSRLSVAIQYRTRN